MLHHNLPNDGGFAPVFARAQAASIASALSGATMAMSLPLFATYSGSSPSISHALRTAGLTGTACSSSAMPTELARDLVQRHV